MTWNLNRIEFLHMCFFTTNKFMGCLFCQHCIRCFLRVEAFSTNQKEWMINFGLFRWFILTLFFPVLPFDPPENIRKPLVFWCFQVDQKGTLGRKRVMKSNIVEVVIQIVPEHSDWFYFISVMFATAFVFY